jgi:tetratricopeptide (TPR) repeat protein
MRARVFLIVCFLLFLGNMPVKAQKKDGELCNKASNAIDQRQFDKAIKYCNDALKVNPESGTAYWLRATAFHETDQYNQSIDDYTKCLGYFKDSIALLSDIYTNRGEVYHEIKKYSEAIDDFNKAIKLKPDNGEAYWGRATANEYLEQFEKSISDYTIAIKYTAENKEVLAVLYKNRAGCFIQVKDFNKAIHDCDTALKFNTDYGDAYRNRGIANEGKELYDDAISDLSHAIKYALNNPDELSELYNMRGDDYVETKKYNKAISDYKSAIFIKSDRRISYENLAEAYGKINQPDLVTETYRKAFVAFVNKSEDLSVLYDKLGNYHRGIGRFDEAMTWYEQALQANPKNTQILWERGTDYEYLENYDKAIETYRKAIEKTGEVNEDLAILHVRIGKCLEHQKKYDEALKEYDLAIKLNPKEDWAYSKRALLYANLLNNKAKAREDFDRLEKLDSVPTYYTAFGKLYNGKKDEALKDINASVKLADSQKTDVPLAYYNAACIYSLMQDEAKSIANLDTALAKGWTNFQHLKRDTDLENIRSSKAYKDILQKYNIQ